MPKRFGFPKAERLKSRKRLDALFAEGKSVSVPPVRAVYQFTAAEEGGLKVGVSASKRYFRKAIDRNRIKRLLREAYRLQKEELVLTTKEAGLSGVVFFLYNDKTIADFETIKTVVGKCLERLSKNIQRGNLS
jgi:ribonuclease P protein component